MDINENMNYVDNYMQKLRAARAISKLEREKAGPPKNLKDEIIEFYESLPENEQKNGLHMDFLKKRFGCPSKIGVILTEIGFTSKRSWSRRPYRRYWFGPEIKVDEEIKHVQE
ncbi:MAG: hypothetical protein PHR66_07870 [Desulfuromonadaceae bacterium]|nr:hypothetical protein [Desulfuromonadaceae bacterium]